MESDIDEKGLELIDKPWTKMVINIVYQFF
jgi:hypothetical protein